MLIYAVLYPAHVEVIPFKDGEQAPPIEGGDSTMYMREGAEPDAEIADEPVTELPPVAPVSK